MYVNDLVKMNDDTMKTMNHDRQRDELMKTNSDGMN